jgi:hypothetical protein
MSLRRKYSRQLSRLDIFDLFGLKATSPAPPDPPSPEFERNTSASSQSEISTSSTSSSPRLRKNLSSPKISPHPKPPTPPLKFPRRQELPNIPEFASVAPLTPTSRRLQMTKYLEDPHKCKLFLSFLEERYCEEHLNFHLKVLPCLLIFSYFIAFPLNLPFPLPHW